MYVPNDPMRKTTNQELSNRLGYHPASSAEIREMFEVNRQMFIGLALELNATIPEGREKEAMLTVLQEALMWANAAVAMKTPLESE